MASTKNYVQAKEKYDRVVVLIDMDCFYAQVEELADEKLRGKPIAVVQYVENAGIIAVNYKARAMGVTRHMREKEAKAACSELICVKVPSKYNKADISKYKEAGKRVAAVFEKFTTNLERASVDEAYLDITENVATRMLEMRQKKFALQPHHLFNTYAVEYDNIGSFIKDVSMSVDQNTESADHETKSIQSSKLRLLLGASIVSDIRKAVKEETGYECSAGIGHNKILAKLVCGMNKPNKQTLLPIDSIPSFFKTLPISQIKGLGGKMGDDVCKKLDVKFMDDLVKHAESELVQNFGQRIGSFLYLIARGIDLEKVERKVMNKCIAVSKNFRGKNEIVNINTLKFWLKELSKELKERLENDQTETNRVAKHLTVQFTQRIDNKDVSSSRVVQLNGKTANELSLDEIVQEVFNTIERHTSKLLRIEGKCILNNNVKHLGIGAAKLEEVHSTLPNQLQNLLMNHSKKSSKASTSKNDTDNYQENIKSSESSEKDTKIAENVENEDDTEAKPPQCSDENIFPEITEDQPPQELKAESYFQNDSLIKGEITLKHWLLILLNKLNEDIKAKKLNENVVPQSFQLQWRQLIDDNEMSFSETIPLEIFANNSIKVEFLLNIMKDSSTQFATDSSSNINPISSIEVKAVDFDIGCLDWNLTIENATESELEREHEKEEEHVTMEKEENCQDEINLNNSNETEVECHPDLLEMENEYLQMTDSFENSLKTTSEEKENNFEKKMEPNENEEKLPTIKVKSLEDLGAGPSYIQTYAEFDQNSIVETLNPLEECLECGKMIRKFDMLTHLDGHIAMQISMSQREEYRAEQKRKLLCQSNQKSATKKPHKSKSTPSASLANVTLIEKFASKVPQKEDIPENYELCEQCNTLVLKEDMQSHADHHFAQKLRMEQLKSKIIPGTLNNKRKRPSPNNNNNDNQKTKSLKAYFNEQ